MASGLQLFVTFLVVSLFYSFAVSLIVPALPNATQNQVVMWQGQGGGAVINISTLSNSIQSGVSSQTKIPALDFGSLVFYSSNIILNLMVNFFTAIPQMITLVLAGLFLFIPNVSSDMQTTLKVTFQAIVTIIYFIGILTFIMGARSGKGIGGIL